MGEAILLAESMVVEYGVIRALNGVSVSLREGEIVSVIGRNGAGKTTLIRAIMGLVRLKQGRVIVKGRDLTGAPPWERAKLGLGYIPEGRRLFPYLTVEENLIIGGYLLESKKLRDRLEYVFSLFPRLRERRKQQARTLSGGEAQMLAIARGLMNEPSILLMDEPSQGLAPIVVEQLFEIIRKLREEGYSILLVEQNARKAIEVSDKIYLLETGNIVLEADPTEASKNPKIKSTYLGD
ncbi:MAG: ABC transporter ATP-binding protein [Desulfurococcales archaeon]|nr:ABC transporter ATP-binding protein [Desulfurococcales archaeon]